MTGLSKLTVAQKHEMYNRYISEKTSYKKIAAEYGISQQAAYKTIKAITLGKQVGGSDRLTHTVDPANVIYPAIEAWRQREAMPLEKLAVMCDVAMPTLRSLMYKKDHERERGKDGPCMRVIDAILRVTGMTYEEAFRRADAEEGAENNERNEADCNPGGRAPGV